MRLSLCLARCQNNATSLTSCTRSGCRFLRTVDTPAHVLASSFFHSGCHSLRRDINRIHDLRLISITALIPVYVMQKTLWEVADVIEQNLHNCLHHKLAPGPRRPGSRDFSTIARSIRFAAQSGLGGFLAAAALTRHSLWLVCARRPDCRGLSSMMFEQFAAVVRDWQSRLSPDQARECAEGLRRQVYIRDLPDEIPFDAVLAAIAKSGPAPVPDGRRKNQLSGGDGPHLNTEKQASSAPKSAPARSVRPLNPRKRHPARGRTYAAVHRSARKLSCASSSRRVRSAARTSRPPPISQTFRNAR